MAETLSHDPSVYARSSRLQSQRRAPAWARRPRRSCIRAILAAVIVVRVAHSLALLIHNPPFRRQNLNCYRGVHATFDQSRRSSPIASASFGADFAKDGRKNNVGRADVGTVVKAPRANSQEEADESQPTARHLLSSS